MAALAVLAVLGWTELKRHMRDHPERFPWTELALSDPVGPFTGMKLAALTDDRGRCLALLQAADMAESSVKQGPRAENQCRFGDGVAIAPENESSIAYAPARLVTACPVAAALAVWEREVVQPAALRHFGSRVVRIDHAGSFSCRRINGQADGPFSEHATADAIDIMGFRLANGRRIAVLGDWRGEAPSPTFLRDVRDGACDLFSTVLSPDYNQAHADHFHFDQAERGAVGARLCR